MRKTAGPRQPTDGAVHTVALNESSNNKTNLILVNDSFIAPRTWKLIDPLEGEIELIVEP